ncbi:MAG: tetratricopeptide repeat protein [Patescibacteria group bacterium]
MQTKHYVWLAVVVGLAVGIGGWLLFTPKTAVAPASSMTASTTIIDLGNGTQLVTTGGAKIIETDILVPAAPKPPAVPALAFAAGTSADLQAALQSQYKTLAVQLKTAPTRVDLWLQLGIIYKIAGQYPAAVTAWTYVAHSGSSPSNYVAYGNLGDLYLNFTREYQKAEASYRGALKLQPSNADYQAGLKAAQAAQ